MGWLRFHLAILLNSAAIVWTSLVTIALHAGLIWFLLTHVGWGALLVLVVTVPLTAGLSEVGVRRLIQLLISDTGRLWHAAARSGGPGLEAFERPSQLEQHETALFDWFLQAATRYGSSRVQEAATTTMEARHRNQSTIAIRNPS